MYASIEAGGTKFVCAIGNDNLEIIEKTQFATTTPEETLKKTIEFLKPFEKLLICRFISQLMSMHQLMER